jgi:hypothetical protein
MPTPRGGTRDRVQSRDRLKSATGSDSDAAPSGLKARLLRFANLSPSSNLALISKRARRLRILATLDPGNWLPIGSSAA